MFQPLVFLYNFFPFSKGKDTIICKTTKSWIIWIYFWCETKCCGIVSKFMVVYSPFFRQRHLRQLFWFRAWLHGEFQPGPTGLKFCCDYMTNFSPGWNISLGAKYEIARKQSQDNQNGAGNTNRENRCIVSFTVWPFSGAQFSAFLGW